MTAETKPSLADGEVLGQDADGGLIQWNATTGAPYNSGQTVEEFGISNLSEAESKRLNVSKSIEQPPPVKYVSAAEFAKSHRCDSDWVSAMGNRLVPVLYAGLSGTTSGYEATILGHYSNGMYDVRLPGGVKCIGASEFEFVGKLKLFEVTAAGFDASTDETDELVYWVAAMSAEEVQAVIEDTGAAFCGEVAELSLQEADFTLPAQSLNFASALLQKASDHRNRNRAVAK